MVGKVVLSANPIALFSDMSWFSKEYETPFERRPIAGLFFLDGDVYSRVVERDATIGLKSPKICFPSGRAYPLIQSEDQQLWLQLFGTFAVPLFCKSGYGFHPSHYPHYTHRLCRLFRPSG